MSENEVIVYSEEGNAILNMYSLERRGDDIVMRAKLMGAWDSMMYITPEMILKAIKLALSWKLVWYGICLPFLFLKNRIKKN